MHIEWFSLTLEAKCNSQSAKNNDNRTKCKKCIMLKRISQVDGDHSIICSPVSTVKVDMKPKKAKDSLFVILSFQTAVPLIPNNALHNFCSIYFQG